MAIKIKTVINILSFFNDLLNNYMKIVKKIIEIITSIFIQILDLSIYSIMYIHLIVWKRNWQIQFFEILIQFYVDKWRYYSQDVSNWPNNDFFFIQNWILYIFFEYINNMTRQIESFWPYFGLLFNLFIIFIIKYHFFV